MKISKLLIAATIVLAAMTMAAEGRTRSAKESISRNLDIFSSVYKALQQTYVDSIDLDKSMRTAIDAMLSDIDPYTEYFPEENQEDLTSISTGDFGGIGAYIRQNKAGNTIVGQPQPGTPASKAGLKAGDVFITIDSDTVLTIGSEKVRERLRGQAGTDLTVTVKRPYATDSILTFTLTRDKIAINPVPYYGMGPDSVGYIQLTTFNGKAVGAVTEAVKSLASTPGIKGLILDLRGNGGGLMESAVDIVGLFVPKGTEVLRTRGRGNEGEKIYRTTTRPVALDLPLAVVIDGGSASSSEITAGALQDLDRAIIVGNRSYGKGLVQSSRPIPYNGLLKVTVAKYYIPSGRLIQAVDYSHRNADGSVARIPDSLTNVYHTRLGRQVRDGGGITPDTIVTIPDINRLTYNIVLDQWDFNFATKYASEHPTIASPDQFEVTDEIYDAFKASIDPEKLQYDKVCELIVNQLEEAAKLEGYLSDEVTAEIASLRSLLHHDLNKDLDTNRERISEYIANELLDRYYPEGGTAIYHQLHDEEVATAASLLKSGAYKTILSSPGK